MNVLILGGFLGSGKTSILIELARYLARKPGEQRDIKVAVIENEIGEIGVDDKLLYSEDYKVETMFSGCACCTLAGALPERVKRIQKQLDPEWLIIECSGLGYPSSVRQTIKEQLGIDSQIFVVVDAARWLRMIRALGSLLLGQFEYADVILINKIDLVTDEVKKRVEVSITSCQDFSAVVTLSMLEGVKDSFWEFLICNRKEGDSK